MASIQRRTVVKGKYINVVLDMSDLLDENNKFVNSIKYELPKYLKSKKTADKMAKYPIKRLEVKALKRTGRIGEIISAIKNTSRKTPYFSYPSPSAKRMGRGPRPPVVGVGVGNKSYLNERTQIAELDQKFRPFHITNFSNQPKNPPKKIGQASKTRKHLWLLYELPRKPGYNIPARSGPLYYTKSGDGYSKWHIKRHSTYWYATSSTAFSAYYFLNSSRQVYEEEKPVFAKEVKNGILKIIREKTRFNK